MRKIVGIPDKCDPELASIGINYTNAVIRGGHIPMVLPQTTDLDTIKEMVSKVDVILFPGGGDIAPSLFGEEPSPYLGKVIPERDAFEYRVLEEAVKQNKPVFGICRGMQVVNVFFGGTLYQDIPSEYESEAILHSRPDKEWEPVHEINIEEGSRLAQIISTTHAAVNSTHHQSVKKVAPGFKVTARANDGIIEAIESEKYPIHCVQFHPERLVNIEETPFVNLFKEL